MQLNDKIDFKGNFKITTYYADGTTDVYEEKNLIMDEARRNMANLIGGVTSGSDYGFPIDKIVLGTLGHSGGDILDPIAVGEEGFETVRTATFSEEDATAYNYRIDFDVTGTSDETVTPTGDLYSGSTFVQTDASNNTVQRVVSDRSVTYTVTIPAANANPEDGSSVSVIPYTEAALYANGKIFSQKCFAARVKESTVSFVIEWSLLF